MMVSAQRLTATRDCAAWNCTLDAEPNASLCWRCVRKPTVILHVAPDVYTGPTLRCCGCRRFLPDEAFNRQRREPHRRRGRHQECRECCAQRRRDARALMTREQKDAEAARTRAMRAARKAALNAIRETYA